ncbi:hypothetical protein BDW22DRAFT_90618 [Trametopsis cervina]|nr:hypothetical protein BDW22DRAFT_90618 [Trametopsis cervina]
MSTTGLCMFCTCTAKPAKFNPLHSRNYFALLVAALPAALCSPALLSPLAGFGRGQLSLQTSGLWMSMIAVPCVCIYMRSRVCLIEMKAFRGALKLPVARPWQHRWRSALSWTSHARNLCTVKCVCSRPTEVGYSFSSSEKGLFWDVSFQSRPSRWPSFRRRVPCTSRLSVGRGQLSNGIRVPLATCACAGEFVFIFPDEFSFRDGRPLVGIPFTPRRLRSWSALHWRHGTWPVHVFTATGFDYPAKLSFRELLRTSSRAPSSVRPLQASVVGSSPLASGRRSRLACVYLRVQ